MLESVIELERKLSECTAPADRLPILLKLIDEKVNSDYVEGWRYGMEAVELADAHGDRLSIAMAHDGLANYLWKLAEYTEALDHFEIALDNFLGLGNLHSVAKCYCGMGIIYGTLQEYRTALDYFEEGLSAARRAGRDELAATLTGNIGHVYFKFGRYTEAINRFQHGLDYYREVDNAHGAANMLSGMAGIYVYQGEYAKGLELVRRALALHKKAKHLRGISVTMMNVGIALQKMGKHEEAFKELKSALNYARSISLKPSEYEILKCLSEVSMELGLTEESAAYLQLYMEGEKEEKKLAVQRKTEQFRKRQEIKERSRKV